MTARAHPHCPGCSQTETAHRAVDRCRAQAGQATTVSHVTHAPLDTNHATTARSHAWRSWSSWVRASAESPRTDCMRGARPAQRMGAAENTPSRALPTEDTPSRGNRSANSPAAERIDRASRSERQTMTTSALNCRYRGAFHCHCYATWFVCDHHDDHRPGIITFLLKTVGVCGHFFLFSERGDDGRRRGAAAARSKDKIRRLSAQGIAGSQSPAPSSNRGLVYKTSAMRPRFFSGEVLRDGCGLFVLGRCAGREQRVHFAEAEGSMRLPVVPGGRSTTAQRSGLICSPFPAHAGCAGARAIDAGHHLSRRAPCNRRLGRVFTLPQGSKSCRSVSCSACASVQRARHKCAHAPAHGATRG